MLDEIRKETLFEEVYKAYYSGVYKYIHVSVKDSWLTEDILAEVFIKIYKHKNEITGVEESSRWVFKIAKNTLIDFYRKKNRVEEVEDCIDSSFYDFGYDYILIKDEYEKVKKIINTFPEETQRMVYMRFSSGLKFKEIADQLELSESTVKCKIIRTIKKVKKLYETNESCYAN